MNHSEAIELRWNLEIDLIDRGKRKRWHQRTHNIVTNTGRQFLAEVITASAFGPSSFVRTQDTCVRYIGFGIGGARQSNPSAASPPLSVDYAGTNLQTDTDVTVAGLERPVRVTSAPLWMREISTPGTFPSATSTRFIAVFSSADLNYGSYTSVPLSEIALYKSSADPSLPNGSAGAYPGAGGHTIAYDTFNPIEKTGVFSIEVRWDWRFA